jgi:hypothetical protein
VAPAAISWNTVRGECGAIITGGDDLLILNPFRGIHVLAPSAIWKWESDVECSMGAGWLEQFLGSGYRMEGGGDTQSRP